MALIVEDGTGLSTAESYISVANASTYHTARGNAAWAALASDTVREQSLRKATDYMGQVYRARWAGCRYTTTQALDWPRDGVSIDEGMTVIEIDEIPAEVTRACAELALKAASESLLSDQTQAKLSVTVGPISTTFDPHSPIAKRFSAIDALLRPYLMGGGSSFQAVRQ